MFENAKYLSENEKIALSEIIRRVSSLFQVKQYILFGSKARGDATLDSDIDLLLITGKKLNYSENHKIVHEIFEVNLTYGTNFTYIDVDAETWESELWKYVPLHKNVIAEGVLL